VHIVLRFQRDQFVVKPNVCIHTQRITDPVGVHKSGVNRSDGDRVGRRSGDRRRHDRDRPFRRVASACGEKALTRFRGPYAYMRNFYPAPSSTGAAYPSSSTRFRPPRRPIRQSELVCANLARARHGDVAVPSPVNLNWNGVKTDVLRELLLAGDASNRARREVRAVGRFGSGL
jgi:hypothetical protein